MKLFELSNIKSERGLKAVLNSLWFGSKGALLANAANFEQMANTVRKLTDAGYGDRAETIRNSNRYVTLEQRANEAAERAASIHAWAEAHGLSIAVDFTPDYQRGKDEKQLQVASEASGVDINVIKEKERRAIENRYHAQLYAQMAAEALFWSADGGSDNVEIRAETVLNSLTRQRDFMLEWSNLDLGELTLLKHDIDHMLHLIDLEGHRQATDGTIDEGTIHEPSMSDMNRQYQKEISDTRKALSIDEKGVHSNVTVDGLCDILAANKPAKPIGKGGKAGTAKAVKA